MDIQWLNSIGTYELRTVHNWFANRSGNSTFSTLYRGQMKACAAIIKAELDRRYDRLDLQALAAGPITQVSIEGSSLKLATRGLHQLILNQLSF